jgi:hypothetical protein
VSSGGRGRKFESSHPDHSLEKKSLSQEIQRLFFVGWSDEMEVKIMFTKSPGAILDREATRRVAGRTPAIKSSHPD